MLRAPIGLGARETLKAFPFFILDKSFFQFVDPVAATTFLFGSLNQDHAYIIFRAVCATFS